MDRKPVGVCAICGATAYRRRMVPVEGSSAVRAIKLTLCPVHEARLSHGHVLGSSKVLDYRRVQRIRELHKAGLSMREIARALGVSPATVHNRIHRDYAEGPEARPATGPRLDRVLPAGARLKPKKPRRRRRGGGGG